jgi:MFS family permease
MHPLFFSALLGTLVIYICISASYILGPLKSRLQRELGTSHTQFGLLFAAFSLNSTWTPLVGGVLASRLGTTFTSILATGLILLGMVFCPSTYLAISF